MSNDIQQSDLPALTEVEETCFCLNVRKVARTITQQYETFLQPIGLRVTQFSVLVAIGLSTRVSLIHLAELLVMDRTTLARNLKLLEQMKLVSIEPDAVDRRARVIQLTPEGQQILQDALPRWRQAQQEMVSLLGAAHSQSLLADLKTTLERVQLQ